MVFKLTGIIKLSAAIAYEYGRTHAAGNIAFSGGAVFGPEYLNLFSNHKYTVAEKQKSIGYGPTADSTQSSENMSWQTQKHPVKTS